MPSELPSGTKLGRYEIRSLLGAGGMGEVYRARDVRLNRDVAVKVLPAAYSADADRLRRFEQEAQAARALNHPNILAVHDVGAHEGAPYVVSELLEGETLRDMVSTGPLPPRKAINYATMIAHGLAAAHEKGIIHRDLKPENVFITKDDRVKILDFGLAKLIQPGGNNVVQTDVATLKAQTSAGTVMGTAGYMSPEQVRGQTVDLRSDIFSFGAVLYEALSGRRAFHGDSAVESLNAILKEEPPDLNETNTKINPQLEKIVRRCLEKKPERRFHSAHDLSFALEALTSSSDSSLKTEPLVTPAATLKASSFFRSSRLAWIVAGLLALLTIGMAWMYFTRQPKVETRAIKLLILPPAKTFLMAGQPPLISPDGKVLGFVAMDDSGRSLLYVRPLNSILARPLEGSDGAYLPFWSPDSRSLGFFARGKLKRIDISGGQPTTLADAINARGGAWNRDGVIIYCPFPRLPSSNSSIRRRADTYQLKLLTEGELPVGFLPSYPMVAITCLSREWQGVSARFESDHWIRTIRKAWLAPPTRTLSMPLQVICSTDASRHWWPTPSTLQNLNSRATRFQSLKTLDLMLRLTRDISLRLMMESSFITVVQPDLHNSPGRP